MSQSNARPVGEGSDRRGSGNRVEVREHQVHVYRFI